MKILNFILEKNRWAILLVIITILGIGIQRNRIGNLKDKYQSEVKLKNALLDSVDTYQNKEGQWVSEKLTIQANLKELQKMNGQLTADQNKLLNKIKEVNKENSIITAALIQANFKVDSLMHDGDVLIDTLNKTVEFIQLDNPDIKYDFLARGVLPYPPNTKPTLLINNLSLPNEQFIEFHWIDNKKEGYPIAFSVTNTNKYVKVNNINSYAIPELKKEVINPTGWGKVGQWLVKNGKVVGFVAGGVIIGAGGTYILMH